MPKHTYQELVAAGAPELPDGYVYKVEVNEERYSVTAGVDKRLDIWDPYGYAYVFGELNLQNVVNACASAYNDLTDKLAKQTKEEEWLGVYK